MPDLASQLGLTLPSPIERIYPDWKHVDDCELWVKRDDKIHPVISGNKYRKLHGALPDIVKNKTTVVSFGGGYSNHLHALAYCCDQLGVPFHAIVRGHYPVLTPMLEDIERWGASIQFVNKVEYQRRHDADYLNGLQQQFTSSVIIPEGGSQHAALSGVGALLNESNLVPDWVICPVASGATMAGIVAHLTPQQYAIGIGVLKGQGYLEDLVEQFIGRQYHQQWHINHDFHFGGYAKRTTELTDFCQHFTQSTQIPVEPVYSGKLFFALRQLVESRAFPTGSKILALHTGGLQGAR